MSSESYHEPVELISERTRNMHRAVVSLIEELEAIDWYTQRAEACSDAELRSVILHNRDEEVEHAMMTLEWLRRNSPEIDRSARLYLFSQGPIIEVEAHATSGEKPGQKPGEKPGANPGPAAASLGIGGLRRA